MSGSSPQRWVFGFRQPVWWIVPVNMSVFAVVAVGVIVAAVTTGEPPLLFALQWTACVVWNGVWFLFVIGHQVEVDGPVVRWRAPLRRRTVALAQVTGVDRIWFGIPRLKVDGERSLLVMGTGPGWITFLQAIDQAHPIASFASARLERFTARWPGASLFGTGYYRRME